VKQIFWFCVTNAIKLLTVWIPREHNQIADDISKHVDKSDVRLNPSVFQSLNALWGPFSIDLFASAASTQLPCYYSAMHTPSTSGVNAFAHPWAKACYAFPAFHTIGKVWHHAHECSAVMCLILPIWRSAQWWDWVCDGNHVCAPHVQDFRILHPSSTLLLNFAMCQWQPMPIKSYPFVALWVNFINLRDASTHLVFPQTQ
jgi:hypothetical protein